MTAAIARKAGPSRFVRDDDKWQAIVRRDAGAEGAFYYSVHSTGVYCRPSCPARLPRRENVAFHASTAAAEAAGFRPCKRCRPDQPPLAVRQAAEIARACRLIEASEELPGLHALAKAAGMSRFHFHRLFKAQTGMTPKAYAAATRARRLRRELPKSTSVTDAIYAAGYGSSSRFYAASEETLGMQPDRFRKGGAGESIRFAVGQSALGAILVAASDRGICAILMGDDADALARELQDRFPKAEIVAGDAAFAHWVAKVVGFVEAPQIGLDLPLDIRGTAFQQRVWRALREIPPGSTMSYAEIAEKLGMPRGARAVATACASNAIAVAIPCHRVVRNDGAISGYRWGVERKRALLKREAGR